MLEAGLPAPWRLFLYCWKDTLRERLARSSAGGFLTHPCARKRREVGAAGVFTVVATGVKRSPVPNCKIVVIDAVAQLRVTSTLTPMPMASVRTAVMVNPGDFHKRLNAYCKSWTKLFMDPLKTTTLPMISKEWYGNPAAKQGEPASN